MAASKRATYAQALQALPVDEWEGYLRRESTLPGPRGNLELMYAAADVGSEAQFVAWVAAVDPAMPGDDPGMLPLMAGLVGLGRCLAEGHGKHLGTLRAYANDARWRAREAVAMALQRVGGASIAMLGEIGEDWAKGTLLERRAVMAGICEPALLQSEAACTQALTLMDDITASLLAESDRRCDAFRALRQALGYGWSVVLAAAFDAGRARFEHWAASEDRDVRWLVKENLKKNRLARCAPEWVAQLQASLS